MMFECSGIILAKVYKHVKSCATMFHVPLPHTKENNKQLPVLKINFTRQMDIGRNIKNLLSHVL